MATAVGITVILSALEVPRVSVLLKITAMNVSLTSTVGWNLHDLPSTRVSFSHAETLRLDGELAGAHTSQNPGVRPRHLSVRAADGAAHWSGSVVSDYLRLNVAIPLRSTVRLVVPGMKSGVLSLTVAGGDATGTLDTGREFRFSCNGCILEEQRDGRAVLAAGTSFVLRPQPRELAIRGGGRAPLVVSMDFPADERSAVDLTLGEGLRVSDVRFERDASGVPASSLAGLGSIEFPELEIAAVAVQPGDFVHLIPWTTLAVRRISVDKAIHVELQGAVRELRSGPPGVLRSRMPTVLRFIYGNKSLQLALGAALTIASAVGGTLYRLGFLSRSGNA